jgi:hypothetical protein
MMAWNRSKLVALLLGLVGAFASPARAQQPPEDTAPPPPPEDEEEEAAPPPTEIEAPAQPPDDTTFEQALTPYGRWVATPDYGRVWVPSAAANPDWQPYTDGRWVYTGAGWAFASDVPWGWAAFHYGRWGWVAGTGWFWVPGRVWAPAWVSWRYNNGHVSWSPYAPRGFAYGPRWRGWVVVPAQHFTHPIAREVIPRAHAAVIVRTSRPAPSIVVGPERGRVYGPPRAAVGRPVRVVVPARHR